MKIGIFDSGLGGLIVAHSLVQALPQYDYVYLGDTARVPYGGHSQRSIYEFTQQAIEYLLRQDCQLVILACNTASAKALRQIQRTYLPRHFPDRRVLGVLIPAAEAAVAATKNKRVGVIATQATVSSQAFAREIHKLDPTIELFQQATPLLVPLIENGGLQYAKPILYDYLQPLRQQNIDTLVLGCTHYPLLKKQIQKEVGEQVTLISQDQIVPEKTAAYLQRHPEIESKLSRQSSRRFCLTDLTPSAQAIGLQLFGKGMSAFDVVKL
jgi:glutamate racemase